MNSSGYDDDSYFLMGKVGAGQFHAVDAVCLVQFLDDATGIRGMRGRQCLQ